MATDRLINQTQGEDIIDQLQDIAANVGNITYGPQTSSDKVVSMTGYAKASTEAAISQGDTLNEAVGKLEKKADDALTGIDTKVTGPESAVVGDVAVFNNVNGKVVADSAVSISTTIDNTKDTEIPTSKAVDTYLTGKGYATGVSTSTANNIVTFNGTDGKALKDSGITVATSVADDNTKIPTAGAVYTALSGKQDTLTTAQLSAVDSGIDSTKVAQIAINTTNISNTQDMICDAEFSTSTAYAVGDIVTYNNSLYEFTSAHSAGAWDSADVTQIDVVGIIGNINTVLEGVL